MFYTVRIKNEDFGLFRVVLSILALGVSCVFKERVPMDCDGYVTILLWKFCTTFISYCFQHISATECLPIHF